MAIQAWRMKEKRTGDPCVTPKGRSVSDPSASVDHAIVCAFCGTTVSHPNAVFRMDTRGPVAAFANPAGFLRRVVTVRSAQNLTAVGVPTTEFTWFPGYAWTVAVCVGCGRQLGWIYDAVAGASPLRFYGLLTEAIKER